MNPFEIVAKQIRELEDLCLKFNDLPYDELYNALDKELKKIKAFAERHDVPLVIEPVHILMKSGRFEDASSYEDESYYGDSESYYEDEESNY